MTTSHAERTRRAIVAAIRQYQADHGYPPTIRELQAMCGLSSTSVVSYHLVRLQAAGRIVRDPVVYQAELNQYDAWATKQAALLKGFVQSHCVCDGDKKFTTPECVQSVDFILTIEARAAWHKDMSLFLAGIKEVRPPGTPPAIADNSTLCPGGM